MFSPNLRCKYRRRLGTDRYGKPTYGPIMPAMCGIVRLEEASDTTSVRADSSASRGSAMEEMIQARILFPGRVKLANGDMVMFDKYTMTVASVRPRHSIAGVLDHWQVDLSMNLDGDDDKDQADKELGL